MGDGAWKERVLELHLLDAHDAITPPAEMRVSFLGFLRDEMKFPSLSALSAQILVDSEKARGYLRESKP